jgi:hypothetical protein
MVTGIASTDKLNGREIRQISPIPDQTTLKDVLKHYLARELHEAELKLAASLKLAGKPCDCLNNGRNLNLETTTQKLTSLDPNNRVYREIEDWIQRNRPILSIQSVQTGQYDQEYPQMARQLADFRKRVLGTASLAAMSKPTQPTATAYSAVAIC